MEDTHVLNLNACNLRINLGSTTLLCKTKCVSQKIAKMAILLYSEYNKGMKLTDEMTLGILADQGYLGLCCGRK